MYYYRKIRTNNEHRYNSGYEADRYEDLDLPPVRAKRNNRNLPNGWDDIEDSSYGDRCWKRHRKTQWKPKEEKKEKKHSKFRGHINPNAQFVRNTKRVYAWEYRVIGSEWNPNGHRHEYQWINNCYIRVEKIGGWTRIYGWKWVSKQASIWFYEGESFKRVRRPIIKYCSEGQPYFTGEWEEIKE